jgi:hypothetical protein
MHKYFKCIISMQIMHIKTRAKVMVLLFSFETKKISMKWLILNIKTILCTHTILLKNVSV